MAANIIVLNGTTIAGSTVTNSGDVLSLTNAGTIDALAGAVVNAGGLDALTPNIPLGMVGTIDNTGIIAIEAANTLTVNLVLLSSTIGGHVHFVPAPGTITLTGGGEVFMFGADVGVDDNPPYATLEAALGGSGFENLDNTLHLDDMLVEDEVGLTNDVAGTIDAEEDFVDMFGPDTPLVNHGTISAYRTLTLGDTVVTDGLIEAEQFTTYIGTIDLSGSVANTGGTLAAVSGATLLLDVVAIHGGTIRSPPGMVSSRSSPAWPARSTGRQARSRCKPRSRSTPVCKSPAPSTTPARSASPAAVSCTPTPVRYYAAAGQ